MNANVPSRQLLSRVIFLHLNPLLCRSLASSAFFGAVNTLVCATRILGIHSLPVRLQSPLVDFIWRSNPMANFRGLITFVGLFAYVHSEFIFPESSQFDDPLYESEEPTPAVDVDFATFEQQNQNDKVILMTYFGNGK